MDKELIKSEFKAMFPDALYSQRTKAIEFAEHIAKLARKEALKEAAEAAKNADRVYEAIRNIKALMAKDGGE